MSSRDVTTSGPGPVGQSQSDRVSAELDAHAIDVDEFAPAERLARARALAARVAYFRESDAAVDGDWTAFFPTGDDAALLARTDGAVPPHLGLFAAFLSLYEHPRRLLNRVTGAHRDFYFGSVLGFRPRAAEPDRAHVVFELKKGAPATLVTPTLRLAAGKDARGVERLYAPVRDTVLHACAVDSLRAVAVETTETGEVVRFAPIADSADGLGAPLAGPTPAWSAFGAISADGEPLPPAQVGFALAAPVLRMREGVRKVRIAIGSSALDIAALLGSAFQAFVSGEKGWLGPYDTTATAEAQGAALTFSVPAAEDAVVDHRSEVHGDAFPSGAPVVQLLLAAGGESAYGRLKAIKLTRVSVAVEVSGVTSLALEGDAGTFNPKRSFLPFGPRPVRGARFMIGHPEALSKAVTDLDVEIRWLGLPTNFADHYAGYPANSGGTRSHFKVTSAYRDVSREVTKDFTLFPQEGETTTFDVVHGGDGGGGDAHGTGSSNRSASRKGAASSEMEVGNQRLKQYNAQAQLLQPRIVGPAPVAPTQRAGFITLTLQRDGLHDTYQRAMVANAIKLNDDSDVVLPNPPYAPTVGSVTLSYKARSEDLRFDRVTPESFFETDVGFFHVGCFGTRREHGFLRTGRPYLPDVSVPLLPRYDRTGELLIGVTGIGPGDGVSLLLQVAEGSADPDLETPAVEWSVLCDNHWRPLDAAERPYDGTRGLRRSGVVALVIPREATTENTFLPSGPVWLRAAIEGDPRALPRVLAVLANGVEVRFIDQGNDPASVGLAVPSGSITRLKTPVAAIKKAAQPYSSFGGRVAEGAAEMATRTSERLRHKGRCVTPWDYERITLDAFPEIYRVRCVPHAKPGAWAAPGHVLLVVVPDLRNRHAPDPLQPRLDLDTLARVEEHLRARAGGQVVVRAVNPTYERVTLDFKVKLRPGREFNFWSERLKRELVEFLSPWAFDTARELTFGGRVYRSVVLDFVEERDYVDYVTDFKMFCDAGEGAGTRDLDEVVASRPDAILVSAATHVVLEAD